MPRTGVQAVVRRLVLSLLVLALIGAPIGGVSLARAQEDDEEYDEGYENAPPAPEDQGPVPADYEDALAPYGSWADDDQYGRVREPSVSVGWAPYVDGSWGWTPYGWTWVSYEPWAWTFHYGRWALLPAGWVWVPGFVWGPAWVDWFWGDGFVGWAPLSPFGHVTFINQFVFVHERDFCSRGLAHAVVDHHFVPDRVIHHWQHRGPDARPPALHHIERVSDHRITRIAPHHFERNPRLTRPARDLPGSGGPHRLGRGFRPGEATLGHAWDPGPGRRAPAAPRVVRPGVGTAWRPNPWRANLPPRRVGTGRPASGWVSPPRAFSGGERPRFSRPAGRPSFGAPTPRLPSMGGGRALGFGAGGHHVSGHSHVLGRR